MLRVLAQILRLMSEDPGVCTALMGRFVPAARCGACMFTRSEVKPDWSPMLTVSLLTLTFLVVTMTA